MTIKKSGFWWKFFLWKAYFEKGMGILSYSRYFIFLFAFASQDIKNSLLMGLGFFLVALIIGKYMYWKKLVDIEAEIGNIINPFAREVRGKLGLPNQRKI